MVSAEDAIEIIGMAESADIEVRLDGGWGVDALLGRQTRPHNDIDLFIERRHAERFAGILLQAGFRTVRTDFTTPAHTVWRDDRSRIVDLHLFEFAEDGSYLFEGMNYPAGTFGATGRIAGKEVRCIPAEEQVLFHLGYEHDAEDLHDVLSLCDRFGIPIPEQYKH